MRFWQWTRGPVPTCPRRPSTRRVFGGRATGVPGRKCGERGKAPWAGGAVSLHSTGQVGPVTYLLSSSHISIYIMYLQLYISTCSGSSSSQVYYIPARAHYTRSGLNRLPSVYFLFRRGTHTLISHHRKWNPVLWELDRVLYMFIIRVGNVCVCARV